MEIILEASPKIILKIPCNPAKSLPSIYSNNSLPYKRDICTSMLSVALFTIAWKCKQPRSPTTGEQTMKMWYTMNYYSSIKNNKTMKFTGKYVVLEKHYFVWHNHRPQRTNATYSLSIEDHSFDSAIHCF